MKQTTVATEQYKNIEILYLISLIKSAINETQPVSAPNNLDWLRLYNIAKRHMVIAMVYPCVKSVGGCPADLLARWKQQTDMALVKELQFDVAREEIFEEFNKNGIDYLPLKGIIIKDFYPHKGMRQFSDNDILFRKKDELKVHEIMLSLGYSDKDECFDPAVAPFKKEPFFNFELHRELFSSLSSMSEYFNDVWVRAVKDGVGCGYHMTDEDFYVFFLAHFHKHYKTMGGCGLRFFSDLYLVQHGLNNLNRKYVNECLEIIGMLEFEKEVTDISESFFGNSDIEIDSVSLKYIIDSGAYGTTEHSVSEKIGKSRRLISIIKIIFPSLKEMQMHFKVLNKLPVLLPVFYVVRWLSILFTGSKRAKFKIAIKIFFKRN